MPQAAGAGVSHWQYVASSSLLSAVHERCWTHALPGVVLLLVSNGLEIVCPWLIVLHCPLSCCGFFDQHLFRFADHSGLPVFTAESESTHMR